MPPVPGASRAAPEQPPPEQASGVYQDPQICGRPGMPRGSPQHLPSAARPFLGGTRDHHSVRPSAGAQPMVQQGFNLSATQNICVLTNTHYFQWKAIFFVDFPAGCNQELFFLPEVVFYNKAIQVAGLVTNTSLTSMAHKATAFTRACQAVQDQVFLLLLQHFKSKCASYNCKTHPCHKIV